MIDSVSVKSGNPALAKPPAVGYLYVGHHESNFKMLILLIRCGKNLERIFMANKIELPKGWEWDGRFLKNSSNKWEFDGKQFKPYSGASYSNKWEYDGKYIQPYSGANYSNKWEVTSTQVKPYSGATSGNTYERNNQPIAVIIAKVIGLF